MKLFERWLAHSFDWQSLGLALLIVIVSFLLIRGVVRGIFHFIEKRIPKRFEAWIDVLMAFENPARVVVLFSGLLLALHGPCTTFADYICDASLSLDSNF